MNISEGLSEIFFADFGSTTFWYLVALSVSITVLGYVIGFVREQMHLMSLRRRERAMPQMVISNGKAVPSGAQYTGLVSVNVALATDSFRVLSVLFRRLVGGRVKRFERIKDRARREVLLRLQDQALAMNANAIYNIRLESSEIRSDASRGGGTSVEVLAYGTAVSVGK